MRIFSTSFLTKLRYIIIFLSKEIPNFLCLIYMETNRPPPITIYHQKMEYIEWLKIHPKGTSVYIVIFKDVSNSDTKLTMVANGNFCCQ